MCGEGIMLCSTLAVSIWLGNGMVATWYGYSTVMREFLNVYIESTVLTQSPYRQYQFPHMKTAIYPPTLVV